MASCTKGGPLSVTFSDVYKVNMTNVVIQSKSIFYRRFIDDTYSIQKLGDDVLFDRLNNYHPNSKITTEFNFSFSHRVKVLRNQT